MMQLQDLLIRIENNGVLVGAGGYGQYGQSTPQNTKQIQNSSNPGGGGGGGAGYHPPLKVESPTSDWIGAANNFTHPSLGDYEAIRDLGISGRLDEHRESQGYDGSTIELDMHRGSDFNSLAGSKQLCRMGGLVEGMSLRITIRG